MQRLSYFRSRSPEGLLSLLSIVLVNVEWCWCSHAWGFELFNFVMNLLFLLLLSLHHLKFLLLLDSLWFFNFFLHDSLLLFLEIFKVLLNNSIPLFVRWVHCCSWVLMMDYHFPSSSTYSWCNGFIRFNWLSVVHIGCSFWWCSTALFNRPSSFGQLILINFLSSPHLIDVGL